MGLRRAWQWYCTAPLAFQAPLQATTRASGWSLQRATNTRQEPGSCMVLAPTCESHCQLCSTNLRGQHSQKLLECCMAILCAVCSLLLEAASSWYAAPQYLGAGSQACFSRAVLMKRGNSNQQILMPPTVESLLRIQPLQQELQRAGRLIMPCFTCITYTLLYRTPSQAACHQACR